MIAAGAKPTYWAHKRRSRWRSPRRRQRSDSQSTARHVGQILVSGPARKAMSAVTPPPMLYVSSPSPGFAPSSRACGASPQPLLFVSTLGIFGGRFPPESTPPPSPDDATAAPSTTLSGYALSKVRGEGGGERVQGGREPTMRNPQRAPTTTDGERRTRPFWPLDTRSLAHDAAQPANTETSMCGKLTTKASFLFRRISLRLGGRRAPHRPRCGDVRTARSRRAATNDRTPLQNGSVD